MAEARTTGFQELLDYLKRTRGFDFSGYKRGGLERRIRHRMAVLGMSDYEAYGDFLEVHPEEFQSLFNAILINVTTFFRDPETWTFVAGEIIPRVLAQRAPITPIRVWTAGCSSGEETYTIAMLLAEALGVDQFHQRVKIYATDIDLDALDKARQGIYSEREIASVPPELTARYFEPIGNQYVFRKELRRSVIFGRHDLMQDAPISRIDLLICRNTLMYFNTEGQAKIVSRLHFALTDAGFLVLGKAEMLLTHSTMFGPVDLKRRVFARTEHETQRDRVLALAGGNSASTSGNAAGSTALSLAAFNSGGIAQVAINSGGQLVLANERSRALFALSPRDIGRPLQDLELSYRPAELRSCIERAYAERRPVMLREVERAAGVAAVAYFDIEVVPLIESGTVVGVSVSFADVTVQRQLREDVEQSREELETAYEELQSTNEELETTNEELQSTVEELETTNEELQSTNEELETMNEELQSTNEELETVNDEMAGRHEEINQLNAFLNAIVASLRGGVAVLNSELIVTIWSARQEDYWGLRAAEAVGKHFLNLDIGLPVEELRQPIRSCLAGDSSYYEVTLNATNRRGKAMRCTATCTRLLSPYGETLGVILLMEDRERSAAPGLMLNDAE